MGVPHQGRAASATPSASSPWRRTAARAASPGAAARPVRSGRPTGTPRRRSATRSGRSTRASGPTRPSSRCGAYLDEWAAGLRLGPSTVASYRKNIRLHLKPYLGAVPLRSLTTARIDALYRELERSGRRDHKGERTGGRCRPAPSATCTRSCRPRSPTPPRPAAWPATRPPPRTPPTAKQAKAPEMHPWTAAQLAAFLAWAEARRPRARSGLARAGAHRHAPR